MNDETARALTKAIRQLTTAVYFLAEESGKPMQQEVIIEEPESFKGEVTTTTLADVKKALNKYNKTFGKTKTLDIVKMYSKDGKPDLDTVDERAYDGLIQFIRGSV